MLALAGMRQYRVRLEADGQAMKVVNFFGSHTFVWVEVTHAPSTSARSPITFGPVPQGDVRSQVADTVRRRESKTILRLFTGLRAHLICRFVPTPPPPPPDLEAFR